MRGTPPRIAIVGIHGHGAAHVVHVRELEASGQVHLVGLVDPVAGPITREGTTISPDDLPPIVPDLATLLSRSEVDIVVVATPLHTHESLTLLALESGADVLLEKPPVARLDDLTRLVTAQEETKRSVQVGFQSLGSRALPEIRRLIDSGAIGTPRAIGAIGSWTRNRAYWTRSSWAGKRVLNGADVLDGAVTNPFAHAVMTALWIAGWLSPESIGTVETDLLRVNEIEADDTSSLRIVPSPRGGSSFDGPITAAFTLAGPREDPPSVIVRGDTGTLRLSYTEDILEVEDATGQRVSEYGRDDLLLNLIAHRRDGVPLLSPLESMGGFMRIMEAIRSAPVRAFPAHLANWEGTGGDVRPVVDDIDRIVARAAVDGTLFREMGLAWAR